MRNNIQQDVKVESGLVHQSKFNRSGLVSTSTNIGLVTPTKCFYMQPHSKEVIQSSELVRLAAMVSPTYGDQKLKNWYIFVPVEEVDLNWPMRMTLQGSYRGSIDEIIESTKAPNYPRGGLCAMALRGSVATLYVNKSGVFANTNCKQWKTASWEEPELPDETTEWNKILSEFDYQFAVADAVSGRRSLKYVRLLNRNISEDVDATIQLANKYVSGWGVPKPSILNPLQNGSIDYDDSPVSLESADLKIYFPLSWEEEDPETHETIEIKYECCLAFRLSTHGVQVHKTLVGLGYGFDLMDEKPVEVNRLLAYYLAYWRVFGLERWQNWETTYVNKLIQLFATDATGSVETSQIQHLFDDIGCLWVTENLDYISAHTSTPTNAGIGNSLFNGLNPVVDVSSQSGVAQPLEHMYNMSRDFSYSSSSDSPESFLLRGDGHSFIKQTFHGFLDSEIMRSAYKLANTSSLLGRSTRKLLTMFGLGDYLKATRDNFVGYTETSIDVQTITSLSDTYKDGSGKQLGQYVGKGIGSKKHGVIKFKSDSAGYLFCLQAMTCDSGYCQGIDETISVIEEYQQYHNHTDGLGYELAPFSIICGQMDIAVNSRMPNDSDFTGYDGVDTPAKKPFGYRPRNAGFKVARNVIMGGFALNSMRKNFITYNMEKLFYPEQRYCERLEDGQFLPMSGNDNTIAYDEIRTMPLDKMPTAGDAWRFLGRYPWMGNLLRIFAQSGNDVKSWFRTVFTTEQDGTDWQYTYRLDDNYMVFQEFTHKDYAPMQPIANTYGTIDPEDRENNFTDRV